MFFGCLLVRSSARPYSRAIVGLSPFSSKHTSEDKDQQPSLPSTTELTCVCLKGSGQVIFLNSEKSGLIILGSLALGDPWTACLAATGSAASTVAAKFCSMNDAAFQNGLLSYNGCLVGCATAVFLFPFDGLTSAAKAAAVTTAGAAASTFTAAALPGMLGRLPQWTFAFNLVTISMLLRAQPLAATDEIIAMTPGITDLLIGAPLKGLSQIFVVESSLSGLGIAAGIASYSPGLAQHALLGSMVGTLTGAVLGVPTSEIAAGLWGFNSSLTSIAVGTFFCDRRSTWMLSAGGAAATAVVFGAMKTIFGSAGSPCLTMPFCVTMSVCYFLADAIPSLQLASTPHSPEKNQP